MSIDSCGSEEEKGVLVKRTERRGLKGTMWRGEGKGKDSGIERITRGCSSLPRARPIS